jgi:polyisoprenoid-binding protein YceI
VGIGRFAIVLLASVTLLYSTPATAQSDIDFTVSGTSTIRGWTCTVTGSAEVTAGSGGAAPGFANGVQAATLTVPVSDFACPNEEMTEHLLTALRPDDFAEIAFQLESYETSRQGAEATGTLTILDTSQPVTFPVSLTPSGQGVAIEGDVRLDMTTYGVEPPVVMLGLMQVRPQIRIQFTGTLSP